MLIADYWCFDFLDAFLKTDAYNERCAKRRSIVNCNHTPFRWVQARIHFIIFISCNAALSLNEVKIKSLKMSHTLNWWQILSTKYCVHWMRTEASVWSSIWSDFTSDSRQNLSQTTYSWMEVSQT
jgi:hypothetical protein